MFVRVIHRVVAVQNDVTLSLCNRITPNKGDWPIKDFVEIQRLLKNMVYPVNVTCFIALIFLSIKEYFTFC